MPSNPLTHPPTTRPQETGDRDGSKSRVCPGTHSGKTIPPRPFEHARLPTPPIETDLRPGGPRRRTAGTGTHCPKAIEPKLDDHPDHPGGRSERIRNFRGVRRTHQAKRIGTRRAEPASTATTSRASAAVETQAAIRPRTITRQPSPPGAATSSPLRRRGADREPRGRPLPRQPNQWSRHLDTDTSTPSGRPPPPSPPNRHPIRDQRTRHRHRGRPRRRLREPEQHDEDAKPDHKIPDGRRHAREETRPAPTTRRTRRAEPGPHPSRRRDPAHPERHPEGADHPHGERASTRRAPPPSRERPRGRAPETATRRTGHPRRQRRQRRRRII